MSCADCVSLPVTGWSDWSCMNCFSFWPFDIALLNRACAAWLDPSADDKIVMLYYRQYLHTKMSCSKEFSAFTHRFTSCEYIKCRVVPWLEYAYILLFFWPSIFSRHSRCAAELTFSHCLSEDRVFSPEEECVVKPHNLLLIIIQKTLLLSLSS